VSNSLTREYLKVSPELLKELPLPEGWTWRDETDTKWPGVLPKGEAYATKWVTPNRVGNSRKVTLRQESSSQTLDFDSIDDAYRYIWHMIALGE
jgi:hypothetical protein